MMKILSAALLLTAALLTPPALAEAEPEPEIYTASTTGELTIDTQGHVVAVTLDRKQLGKEVMDGFERQIMGWQFEPILQDGQAVRATANMRLGMIAIRHKGVDGMRLAFEYVHFSDPEAPAGGGDAKRRMDPPRYPPGGVMDGVGAMVMLMLRLDEEGRVLQAGTESVLLLGEELPGRASRHVRDFSKAAEKAAADWVVPGIEGGVVMVPVRYSTQRPGSERWIRTRNMPVERPDWVDIERAGKRAVALGEGGAVPSARWKLQTSLEG